MSDRVHPPDYGPGTYWRHSKTRTVVRIEQVSPSGKTIQVVSSEDGPRSTWRMSSLRKRFLEWLPCNRPRGFGRRVN